MKAKNKSIFQIVINVIMILATSYCLIPLILLVVSSFTDNSLLIQNGYTFFPKKFSIDAYTYLFEQKNQILRSYGVSVFITIVGVVVGLSITTMLAYAISRENLPGRKFLTFFVFFTMLFNGGLVPTYLMYTNIFHIKNTIFALLIPVLLVRAYYVLLMKSYFRTSIPGEVLEAASIDGAGEILTFIKISLPMSKPILTTIGLFIAILYWNDWQNGFVYLTTRTDLFSVQNLLNRMIQEIQFLAANGDIGQTVDMSKIPSGTVRMAIAVIGILPIATIYPFIQKNFTKGITLGAVKG